MHTFDQSEGSFLPALQTSGAGRAASQEQRVQGQLPQARHSAVLYCFY
jgi:hypothetical protein